jgi:hypothetical protein
MIPLRKLHIKVIGEGNFLVLCLLIFIMQVNTAFGQGEEAFSYDNKGNRDPLVPLVDEQGRFILEEGEIYSFADLELIGILWDPDGGKSSALINDQVVKVGETFHGFLIKDITQNSVTVSQDGQEYVLWQMIEGGEE